MQHRPPGEAVGGELGALVGVEVEGVESLADGAAIPLMRGAPRGRFGDSMNTTTAPCWSWSVPLHTPLKTPRPTGTRRRPKEKFAFTLPVGVAGSYGYRVGIEVLR